MYYYADGTQYQPDSTGDVTLGDVKISFKQLQSGLFDGLAAANGIHKRYDEPTPTFNHLIQKLEPKQPYLYGSSLAFGFNVVDLTAEEVASHLQEHKQQLTGAVQAMLDADAQSKGYDTIYTAALRANIPTSVFYADGVYFAKYMDDVWSYCLLTVLPAVEAGTRPIPTAEELITDIRIAVPFTLQ